MAEMPLFHEIVSSSPGRITVRDASGEEYELRGTRAWRNNNPGNLEYGPFARSAGAIGTDGRFAVFPDIDTGERARERLLFDSSSYSGRTLAEAINRYAPPVENDTNSYLSSVATAAGVPDTTIMSSMTPAQRSAVLAEMRRVEGFRPGTINGVTAPRNATAAINSLVPQMPQNRQPSGILGFAGNAINSGVSGLMGLGDAFRDQASNPNVREAAFNAWLNTPISAGGRTPPRASIAPQGDRLLQALMTRPDISRATKDNYDPTSGFINTVATRADSNRPRSLIG